MSEVALLGIPFDANSSFLRGPALAPPRIRQALFSGSANLCTEDGLDLGASSDWRDDGDLDLSGDPAAAYARIEPAGAERLAAGSRTLCLGGDHSVAYPIVRAYAARYPDLTILQLDAHPDLYEELDGNRHSHASPFARIMEEGLARRLVQVGVRTLNSRQAGQAARFGVEIIAMRDWSPGLALDLRGPLYLSIDLDALDPAFAPGVSHHEPGGFSTRELLGIIQAIDAPIVGADIVEYNPVRDVRDMTAMVAVKVLKEVLGKMVG
jgi:agmatinase